MPESHINLAAAHMQNASLLEAEEANRSEKSEAAKERPAASEDCCNMMLVVMMAILESSNLSTQLAAVRSKCIQSVVADERALNDQMAALPHHSLDAKDYTLKPIYKMVTYWKTVWVDFARYHVKSHREEKVGETLAPRDPGEVARIAQLNAQVGVIRDYLEGQLVGMQQKINTANGQVRADVNNSIASEQAVSKTLHMLKNLVAAFLRK